MLVHSISLFFFFPFIWSVLVHLRSDDVALRNTYFTEKPVRFFGNIRPISMFQKVFFFFFCFVRHIGHAFLIHTNIILSKLDARQRVVRWMSVQHEWKSEVACFLRTIRGRRSRFKEHVPESAWLWRRREPRLNRHILNRVDNFRSLNLKSEQRVSTCPRHSPCLVRHRPGSDYLVPKYQSNYGTRGLETITGPVRWRQFVDSLRHFDRCIALCLFRKCEPFN